MTNAVESPREQAFRRAATCLHRWPKPGCDTCTYATWVASHGGGAPLNDTLAEESVIAACLVDADAIADVHATGISPAEFFHERCAYAYAAVRTLADITTNRVRQVRRVDELTGSTVAYWAPDPAVNIVTVAHKLAQTPAENARASRLEAVGGAAWLSHIVGELPCSIGADWYARIVIDCASRRRAIAAAGQVAELAKRGGSPDMIDRAQALFGAIAPVPDLPPLSGRLPKVDGSG